MARKSQQFRELPDKPRDRRGRERCPRCKRWTLTQVSDRLKVYAVYCEGKGCDYVQ